MSRYYGFSINEIGDMSMYQFSSYLNDISEIEKMFSGGKSDDSKSKTKPLSNKELVARARKKGFITPKHY